MKCRVCKTEKELELFPWAEKGTRRSSRCKDCQKILSKKHYREKIGQYRERDQIRRKIYRDDVLPKLYDYLLNNPCVQCGENEPIFLDFDHIDGTKNKIWCISGMITGKLSWSRILEEIHKCQVLCVKCHRLKTYKEQNTYKYQRYIEKQNLKN